MLAVLSSGVVQLEADKRRDKTRRFTPRPTHPTQETPRELRYRHFAGFTNAELGLVRACSGLIGCMHWVKLIDSLDFWVPDTCRLGLPDFNSDVDGLVGRGAFTKLDS